MFFDSVCIRPQILPFVLNLIICPSSICFPLLYSLYSFVVDFVSVFKFVLLCVFNFATKHFFIKVTSGQVNLLIKIILHCTEGRNPKMDGLR